MVTKLYVISDFHLGGKPGKNGDPGFQICPERNHQRLARFIRELPRPSGDQEVHLVVAGDIVDFLAEEKFLAFTLDQSEALGKLKAVVGRTPHVWEALKQFVVDGGALTLMLGNHDIELCLPVARRHLFELLGAGRIDFIYDNEAFTLGPVLIEHGNRYDAWNAVPYGALRRVRSQLSRRLPAGDFQAMPGSQLVAEVMNQLKAEYSWVDLLKPETAGALPILAALGAGDLSKIWKAFQEYQNSRTVGYNTLGEPENETYIAGSMESTGAAPSDQAMYDLAQDIAAGGDATKVGAADFLKGARDVVSEAVRKARRSALFKALQAFREHHRHTFDMSRESDVYLAPVKAAAERGFKVVVYGHTHLVKRIPVQASQGEALYLNTGTWADLMRMPEGTFDQDTSAARQTLADFVSDLESDNVAKWRRAAPSFALIELDGGEVTSADVFFADEQANERATTEGLLKRLDAAGGHDG